MDQCTPDTFPNDVHQCMDCADECIQFNQTVYEVSVPEDTSPTSTVIRVTVTDSRMTSRPLSFYITAGEDRGDFAMNQETGDVSLNTALDYETRQEYTLVILAVDEGISPPSTQSATAQLRITVTDINDSPPVFTAQTYTAQVSETAAVGTSVFTVTATDQDGPVNAVVRYVIISGNVGSRFAVHAVTGEVTVSDPTQLDFETQQSYSVVVLATDSGTPTLTSTAAVNISVHDENDEKPMFTRAEL